MDRLHFLHDMAMAGGDWVIYILIVFSIVAVAVIIERAVLVTRQARYQESVLPSLTEKLEKSPDSSLLKGLRSDSILYRLTAEILGHSSNGMLSLERHLETRLALERRYLEKRLIILGTLGNNAPFLGLLGTVLGVIRAFHDLGASGGQGPEVVMQGISEALVATAVGILVALPCVAAFNLLKKRAKDILIDADRFGKQLIAVLEAGERVRGEIAMAGVQEEDEEAIMGINVTPLVDITLVLLIIFMATSHIIAHRSMTLSLPKVANSESTPTQTIQILLAADKSLLLNAQKVTAQELAVNLGQMARLDPGLKVTVLADERVSWGDVAGVLDQVRGAGITRIATEVQPKAGR